MKFLKFRKLGILGIVFLLCTTCFLSGRISVAKADGSSTVLPIIRGGTGGNSAAEARTNLNAQEILVSNTNIKTVFDQSLLGTGNVTNTGRNLTTLFPGQSTAIETGYGDFTINDNLALTMPDWPNRKTEWGIRIKGNSWNSSRCFRKGESDTTPTFVSAGGVDQFIPTGGTSALLSCSVAAAGGNYFVNITFDGDQGIIGQITRFI
ncbi:MAG: hypothetical protein LBT91_03005 [Bifidobacteriaceae bacterium]|jgi:hypothetical protein|nr:hypothetical protein [Bifidobacteriaceae bacterium]